ncbi:sensor histidine kinase [Aeromicrobium sp.]|uniref:sensor histidine kinase n=1 Tax=Aeromicrobium sp. TaxID=1871063 RepID=UPI0019C4ABD9|nr:sensor histidine kinase [Aeromicrobium sp.]MBC7631236.1 sensor histidine kinase [Aeromicrobium sp.]
MPHLPLRSRLRGSRGSGRSARFRESTVARQMLVWQLVVVLTLVIGGTALAWIDARSDSRSTARDRALDISLAVATSPTVRTALDDPDPSTALQPYAERVRRATDTDFVVVMNTSGVRYSHPDPGNIGKTFLGHITHAVRGQSFTENYTGTLGPSVRAVVPVQVDGTVHGLVSVGITNQKVDKQVFAALPRIIGAALGAGLLGALGAWLVSRRLRRQTHGLGEQEITRMYEYYDAVLRAVREGLLLLDPAGRLTLMNEEAARLLGIDESAVGTSLAGLGLEPGLVAALASGEVLHDGVHVVGDRVLVVNKAPARWERREVGSVVTLRDRTELQSVTAELDTVRGLAEALRAQDHESTNRMHTMVSVIEIGRPQDAIEFATRELDVARRLADRMVESIEEPVVAALLLGKTTQAVERGVELTIDPSTRVSGMVLTAHEAVTVLGNLLDNAIDAAQSSDDKLVRLTLTSSADLLRLRVEDSGAGVAPADRASVFVRGWSTKSSDEATGRGIGLALVGQIVRRHGGSADVRTSPLGGAEFDVQVGGGA